MQILLPKQGSLVPARARLPCDNLELTAVFEQGARIVLTPEKPRLLSDSPKKRRFAGGDQTAVTDVLNRYGHKRTGLDITLRVDM